MGRVRDVGCKSDIYQDCRIVKAEGPYGKFSAVRKEIQWHESLAVAVRRKGRCTLYDNRLYLVVLYHVKDSEGSISD